MNQLTPEQVKALYFDADAIQLPPYQLYQLNHMGKRMYYSHEITDSGSVIKFYAGVTTLLHAVMKEADQLAIWRENMGRAAAEAYMNNKALYGSMMHTVLTRFLIDKAFDLDQLPMLVVEYCNKNEIPIEKGWAYDIQHDLTAFSRFVKEYEIKPILIEAPMKSDAFGIAGTCDLLAEITIEEKGYWGEEYKTGDKKGEPKETKKPIRVLALIDYKSNRSGSFYESHEIQLEMYEHLVKETFPQYKDTPIRLYNWSPKDWETNPDYNFREQTGKHLPEILPAYITIFRDKQKSDPALRNILSFSGILDLEKEYCWEEVITIKQLKDVIGKNHSSGKQ